MFVAGRAVTTDAAGEFVDTVMASNTMSFEATVRVVISPPSGLGLERDSAAGTVWFYPSATDTLRVEIVLEPA